MITRTLGNSGLEAPRSGPAAYASLASRKPA